jgi:hypothetical protein
MQSLLLSVAKKLRFPIEVRDVPPLPDGIVLGGNEIEGIFVRALRLFELQAEPHSSMRDILGGVFKDIRPSAHTRKLEYMDLVAVKECTDSSFLPPQYREMTPEDLEQRIEELRRFV